MIEGTPTIETDIPPDRVSRLISESGFFSGLTSEEIRILVDWVTARTFPTGTFILKEGEGENCLCILVEGTIDIYKKTEPDKHLKIASIKPDETIGEMGVIDGQPFSASAIASRDSIVLLIGREDFEKLTDQHEKLGIKLLRKIGVMISARLRSTTGRLADLMADKKPSTTEQLQD